MKLLLLLLLVSCTVSNEDIEKAVYACSKNGGLAELRTHLGTKVICKNGLSGFAKDFILKIKETRK